MCTFNVRLNLPQFTAAWFNSRLKIILLGKLQTEACNI